MPDSEEPSRKIVYHCFADLLVVLVFCFKQYADFVEFCPWSFHCRVVAVATSLSSNNGGPKANWLARYRIISFLLLLLRLLYRVAIYFLY